MSPKLFAAVVGGILTLVGLIALSLPISVEDHISMVECGSGFRGLSSEASLTDGGRSVGRAITGDFNAPAVTLEEQCADKIGSRQAWGWPVGGIGAIVLLGALVIQTQQQPIRPRPGSPTPAGGTPDDPAV